MGLVSQFITEFSQLLLDVIPYFVFGVAFSAVLETYIKGDFLIRFLNSGTRSVINASILGAVLPGCACATVPMAESIKSKGSSLGTVTAFIMVSPLVAPHTLILTYGLLGIKFTVGRLIFSLVAAIALGVVLNILEARKVRGFHLPPKKKSDCCSDSGCSSSKSLTQSGFFLNFWAITKKLGGYFLLGMAIASALMVLMPPELIPKYIGSSGILAYVLALFSGIPVYVCEGEEIPITLSLLQVGLGPGPAFTFMLGAVGTCIPTMMMAQKVIGRNATMLYVGSWFIFALGGGLVFGYLTF
jgi:uncharacterized membrane protein YraQ (UPF0718 family)